MSQPRIAGIIFDMDGVLCDSEPFIREAAMRMFDQVYHLQVSPEDFAPFVGAGEDRFIGGVAEKHGVKLVMPRDKERTYAIYLEIIRGRLHPLPGAVAFIRETRRRGLKLALATSADRVKMVGNLDQIGIGTELFDAIVTGEDVTKKKPDPHVFLLAAQRLGLPPVNCLVIEDAVNGVKAGKSAGSRVLGITSTFTEKQLEDAGADAVAPDLAQVPSGVLDDADASAARAG